MSKDKKCVNFDTSATVEQCMSNSTRFPARANAFINAPVILAQLNVNTNMVANIHFPEPVLEIKDIKKTVKIIQCRLLLPTNRLYLKGFVRKNIQYATPCPGSSSSCVSSEMRSLTVDVPFECVTIIDNFITPPLPTFRNFRSEFDFFHAQDLGPGFPEKDQLLSNDLSQFHQVSTQFYNQLPYCEILRSRIAEWDESTDRQPLPGHAPFEEGYFQHIVEKMFVSFTIRVLQNQPVRVGNPQFPDGTLDENEDNNLFE